MVSRLQGREQFVTGDAVRLAAALGQEADAGEVVIGPFARRLLEGATVEPLGCSSCAPAVAGGGVPTPELGRRGS